jgi:hypothetical protein
MPGTETYGAGGTISGGSDSYTWTQTASDYANFSQQGGGPTLASYTSYRLWLGDQLISSFSDAGTVILGNKY